MWVLWASSEFTSLYGSRGEGLEYRFPRTGWWPCKAQLWAYPRIFRGNPVRRSMVRKNRVKVRLRIQFVWGSWFCSSCVSWSDNEDSCITTGRCAEMVLLACYSLPRSRVAIKSEAYVSDNAPESAWVALKRCQETQNSEMNGVGLVKACNRVGRKRGCQKGTLFTNCKNWLESRRR